ncbi:uncharacterized protein [Anabrus simplex]|uniref:uncharacterized protein n=1 Tax=Anabrus simplex TaxID=316456 RepID=UPI0035A3639E
MECLMKWMKCDNIRGIMKKTKIQVIYSTIALYLVVACGTVIGWSAPVLPRLGEESKLIKSLIVSGVFIGMFLAAVPAFFLVDVMGRKKTMILAAIILVVYWVLVRPIGRKYGGLGSELVKPHLSDPVPLHVHGGAWTTAFNDSSRPAHQRCE